MEHATQDRLGRHAEVFKALAHPTRLFVVRTLAEGERCVCELTDMIGADKSTVSKHLSVLRQAGIITDDKRGTMVFYSLRAKCVLGFMKCIETMIAEDLRRQAALHG